MGIRISALSQTTIATQLCGWAGEELAREAFNLMGLDKSLPKFKIYGSAGGDYHGQRRMLYEINRKVLGQDTVNYPQEVGDCTSFGCKNAMEYLQCSQILTGQAEEFKPIYPPFIYGAERKWVGNGQLGYQDGGYGCWVQEVVKTYGVLVANLQDVPQYSGSIARSWGRNGPPSEFKQVAAKHLVKTTAQCNSAADAANAILNGYPVPICSDQGFTMTARSDGFNAPSGSWPHCMCLIGFQDHPTYGLYFIILNSWGDVHGQLQDFDTKENLPLGVLRVKENAIDSMIKQGDSFIYSNFDGFPGQVDVLDKAMFDLVGN